MDLIGGGVDSRGSYISKILYVKMKELGPLGGAHRAPPRSANVTDFTILSKIALFIKTIQWSDFSEIRENRQITVKIG